MLTRLRSDRDRITPAQRELYNVIYRICLAWPERGLTIDDLLACDEDFGGPSTVRLLVTGLCQRGWITLGKRGAITPLRDLAGGWLPSGEWN